MNGPFWVVMLFPFIICVLVVGWLVFLTHGGKVVKLNVKGLGLTINIDTTGNNRRRDTDR